MRRCVLLMVSVILASVPGVVDGKTPVTAILGAFGEEVEIIEAQLEQTQSHTLLGMDFVTGMLKERRVVLAQTGIGKVNAAMTTALLIHEFRPSEVIFTGIAGGIDPCLSPGDIVVAEKVAHHDLVIYTEQGFDEYQVRNPLTGRHNPVFLPTDTRLLNLATRATDRLHLEKIVTNHGERIPRIVTGTIVSGDAFVASTAKRAELRRRFEARAVEMEGAAVGQVCFQQQLPFLVVRSLSNTADSDVHMDTVRFNEVAAHNSARYVLRIVELLEAGSFPDPALGGQAIDKQRGAPRGPFIVATP
ncbi:MAG: 5'-methylthioadenosine/adenosylhomocysteine nucleosidase [Planctomycetota bacterium]|nr:5'-methylthioadenosine/adenosylhomocysteine nucleosidase [Planctomycetota bacterium]